MLNLLAIISAVSATEAFSFSWINLKTSPAWALLKQRNIFFAGMAKKEEIFFAVEGAKSAPICPTFSQCDIR
jgi:hypothetical protein